MVSAGLAEVRQRIAEACARAGREAASVTLIAVSKTKPLELLREAIQAGQHSFGENYAQEFRDKFEEEPGLDWHFIGALQTNKVKYVAGKAALVHTCDRLSLAQELAKRGPGQRVLLEINIGREPQKAGVLPEDSAALLEQARALGLRCEGLMCIPPAEGDPRVHFRALRELASKLGLRELSMGMSADYEAAIEEGATIVRVGTAIFGSRA
ncbi:MAG TPA: YggS family pyridoxal phosphate-dependent enzyme [Myxococcales bacterium]|nr:YggS family pyridoxal phosphate-dependent enzyme [Myxococcales bacterium]